MPGLITLAALPDPKAKDHLTASPEKEALATLNQNEMKKSLLLMMMMLYLCGAAYAQQAVRGRVTSKGDGDGLPGVAIQVKGTGTGTVTDIDGNYSLQIPSEGATLLFSFIGYVTQEVPVNNRGTINITLAEDQDVLDEVVVVGYGTQKKSDVTGAVASVTGEQLRNTVTTNIDQALQGRVAGVQVTQNSGAPGGAVSIRVRGTNSITGSNEPLYVVDGIQFQGDAASSSGFDWAGGANGQTKVASPLSTISPNDIVSIEVLKDASATAIYGSRAANGVVIITTKRGKSGDARITYDGYYASQELRKKLDMMTLPQYAEFQVQMANELEGVQVNDRFLDPSLLGPGTDWQEAVFERAPMQSHQISITGGSDKTQYAIMGGYFTQNGIIIGSGFDRFTTRLNLDSQVKSWFKAGTSLSYANIDETITLNDGGDGVISQALQMPPDVPVRDFDGNIAGPTEGSAEISANPVGLALIRNNTLARQNIQANFYGDATLFEGLSFRSEIGFSSNHGLGKAFVPTYQWGPMLRNDVSQLKQREENSFFWLWKNYFTYNEAFGSHGVNAMLGTEAQRSEYEGSEVFKTNFASNNLPVLSQGQNSTIPTNGWMGSSSLVSYFGRVNYNYAERYLLTLTLRADGSSKFGPNNRWGYFPSASVAWRLANENFMPEWKSLTDLKFRAGYGEVGNQAIPDYAYGSALRSMNSYFGTVYINNRMANPDLKWETTAQYNVGIDASFFGGRVNLTADAYKKFTKDMLLQVNMPNFLGGGGGGIGAPFANVGKLENKGVELSLDTRNFVSSKFTWSSSINFTMNRNKVTELDKPYTRNLYWYAGFDEVTLTSVGNPIGTFYGYVTEGIFSSREDILNHAVQVKQADSENTENPNGVNYVHERDGVWVGDVKFKDLNGDGVINSQDKTIIGNPNPDFTFGFSNNLTFGAFDASFYLLGSQGAEIFNFTKVRNERMNSVYNNQGVAVANRARVAMDENGDPYLLNPGTNVPRFSQLNVNANDRMSDRWIEDGSFIRVQNISLGYTLPKSLTERVKIERLRFYANAQNVFVITKYSGFDPEIGAFNQDALRQNIDMGRYPTPRVFIFGVNVDF